MTFDDILTWSGGGVLLLLTLIQLAPIKLDPWSAIARWIGKAINADVERDLAEIKGKLEKHVVEDDRRNADSHRTRILHFNNELLRDIDHTKEEFIEVLAEIDAYERYCDEHPDYPNNRAVLAIDNIRSDYRERLKKHDFLREGGQC